MWLRQAMRSLYVPAMTCATKPGWHRRGYLPHRDSPGLLQHLVLSARHDVRLDRPEIALPLETAMLYRDGVCYSLQAWAIMPDHVHVAVTFAPDALMGVAVRSWKSWSTTQWQATTGVRSSLFTPDYYDHYARTLIQADQLRFYIEANPVTAGLAVRAEDWRWSSAWHRAQGRTFDRTWLPFFLPPANP